LIKEKLAERQNGKLILGGDLNLIRNTEENLEGTLIQIRQEKPLKK